MNRPLTLCIAIPTLNQERSIELPARILKPASQIVVVDSGSKENTVSLATAISVEAYICRDWQGFGEHLNRLPRHCRVDVIYFSYSVKFIPRELEKEISGIIRSGADGVWVVLSDKSGLRKIVNMNEGSRKCSSCFLRKQLSGLRRRVKRDAHLRRKKSLCLFPRLDLVITPGKPYTEACKN